MPVSAVKCCDGFSNVLNIDHGMILSPFLTKLFSNSFTVC